MLKRKSLLALFLILGLAAAGCGKNEDDNGSDGSKEESNTINTENTSSDITIVDVADMFSARDYETEYEEGKSAVINLDGKSASCDSDAVVIEGGTVTIKDEGTYILRGTLNDGMIVVDADEKDKPQLVLDGVSITSKTAASLYILEADKVFVTLAEGTENSLVNGGSFEAIDDNNIDGVVFSKQDLTFNGSGNLSIESPAGHGIVCKDDLVFTSGTYTIMSSEHGLDVNDSVRYTNTSSIFATGKDGIHVENSDNPSLGFVYVADGSLQVTAEGDGLSAGTYMQIDGGEFEILAGGGSENGTKSSSDSWGEFGGGRGGMGGLGGREQMDGQRGAVDSDEESTSMKGLKSESSLFINGGTFRIDSADDGIHSNTSVTIQAGTLKIATGDDGVHAEETLTVSGGSIDITESYEGLEALHIAVSGGDVKLAATDDGFNAAGGTDSSGMGGRDKMGGPGGMGGMGGSSSSKGTIKISGGNIYMNASGDGIDANGSLEISGGYTVVCGPTQGDTATLDYDTSAVITGGTFIGTGASGMAQTFSDNEQGVFAVSCGNCSAGTKILLQDSKGNEVVSYTPELSFEVVIISTPEMVSGEAYTITVGDYEPGTFEAN